MAKEERRPRRTWIFQGNPKRYDLRDKLVPGETEAWEINAYRDEIQAGDIVYFWRSSGDEAIFGWGEVAREGSDDKPALKAGRDRIAVEYKEPIPREATPTSPTSTSCASRAAPAIASPPSKHWR
jgi:hypothetical protein